MRYLVLKIYKKSGKVKYRHVMGPHGDKTYKFLALELEHYYNRLEVNKTGANFYDFWIDQKRKESFEITEEIL